jgi:hypothetical protein
MTDPAILFVKPDAVRSSDKAKLSKAGVIVVEVDDPQSVRLVRATAPIEELSHGALLAAAAQAIRASSNATVAFGQAVANAILGRAEGGGR